MTEKTFVQFLPDRALAIKMHSEAADEGLAPRILEVDRETVTYEHAGQTLMQWWLANDSTDARQKMKVHLKDRIGHLHLIGICHRDLHSENVMIGHDGLVRFIDFVLAERVDPEWPCYDLEGPSNYVAVPYAHSAQPGHEEGVWWGPIISARCLAEVIGEQPPNSSE